ncbi:MAG: hypothetical protein LBI14_10540 [Treponema sp.]|jgi:hypothetical protein|nr:hypothetical protein [Treponema sp.]
MSDEQSTVKSRLSWHPAFFEAIQVELDEYSNILQFIPEYQLTFEPLRIDVVIIKKSADIPIKKNIATIFRKENIVEYKSPDDYVSVRDFYLVYGYACLYTAMNKADINELTLTFVEGRHPRALLTHLKKTRGYTVEENHPGIYSIKGDILPIQIIDSRQLSAEENLWLRGLDSRLGATELDRVTAEAVKQGKAARLKAYLDVIMKANVANLQEVLKMSRSALTLDKVLEEAGLTAKWEARGEARGLIEGEAKGRAEGEEKKATEIAKNMLKDGFSEEQTAKVSGLDISKVRKLSLSK